MHNNTNLVPKPRPAFCRLQYTCRIRFSIPQAEPGNKASLILHDSPGVKVVIITKLPSIVNSRFYTIQSAILGYCSDCGWCDSGWCVNSCDYYVSFSPPPQPHIQKNLLQVWILLCLVRVFTAQYTIIAGAKCAAEQMHNFELWQSEGKHKGWTVTQNQSQNTCIVHCALPLSYHNHQPSQSSIIGGNRLKCLSLTSWQPLSMCLQNSRF